MDPGRSEAMFAGPLYLLLLLILAWVCKKSKDPRAIAYGIEVWKILKKTGIALLLCVPAAFFFIGFVAPPFIVATCVGVVSGSSPAAGWTSSASSRPRANQMPLRLCAKTLNREARPAAAPRGSVGILHLERRTAEIFDEIHGSAAHQIEAH